MSKLIVYGGRRRVSGGRLVTSAGGAPCCCDGGPVGPVLGVLNLTASLSGSVVVTRPRYASGGFPPVNIYLGSTVTTTTWSVDVGPRNEPVPTFGECDRYPASGQIVQTVLDTSDGDTDVTTFDIESWGTSGTLERTPDGVTAITVTIYGTLTIERHDDDPETFDDVGYNIKYYFDIGNDQPIPGFPIEPGPVILPPDASSLANTIDFGDGPEPIAAIITPYTTDLPVFAYATETIEYDEVTATDGVTRSRTIVSSVNHSVSGTWVTYFPPETPCDFNDPGAVFASGAGLGAVTQPGTSLTPDEEAGIGSMLAEAIKLVSAGTIKPCAACEKRKRVLNRFGNRMGREILRRLGL